MKIRKHKSIKKTVHRKVSQKTGVTIKSKDDLISERNVLNILTYNKISLAISSGAIAGFFYLLHDGIGLTCLLKTACGLFGLSIISDLIELHLTINNDDDTSTTVSKIFEWISFLSLIIAISLMIFHFLKSS